MNSYESLKIWRKAMEMVIEVYRIVSKFLDEEKFGLISQIKRSAVSIPSNIAEGAGRNSKKEFIRFLSMANGSSCELETQIRIAYELDFIIKKDLDKILEKSKEVRNMNFSLQKTLK